MEVDDTESQAEEGEINEPEPFASVKSSAVTKPLDFGTGNRVNT